MYTSAGSSGPETRRTASPYSPPASAAADPFAAGTTAEDHTGRICEQRGSRAGIGERLRQIRHSRGWSQHRLIYAMRQVARDQRGMELPSNESLKAMVSRWENSRRRPSDFNLGLLCSALSVSPADVVPTVVGDDGWRAARTF